MEANFCKEKKFQTNKNYAAVTFTGQYDEILRWTFEFLNHHFETQIYVWKCPSKNKNMTLEVSCFLPTVNCMTTFIPFTQRPIPLKHMFFFLCSRHLWHLPGTTWTRLCTKFVITEVFAHSSATGGDVCALINKIWDSNKRQASYIWSPMRLTKRLLLFNSQTFNYSQWASSQANLADYQEASAKLCDHSGHSCAFHCEHRFRPPPVPS